MTNRRYRFSRTGRDSPPGYENMNISKSLDDKEYFLKIYLTYTTNSLLHNFRHNSNLRILSGNPNTQKRQYQNNMYVHLSFRRCISCKNIRILNLHKKFFYENNFSFFPVFSSLYYANFDLKNTLNFIKSLWKFNVIYYSFN